MKRGVLEAALPPGSIGAIAAITAVCSGASVGGDLCAVLGLRIKETK